MTQSSARGQRMGGTVAGCGMWMPGDGTFSILSRHFSFTTNKGDSAAKVGRLSRLMFSVERHRPFPDALEREPVQHGLAEGFVVNGGVV